MRKKGPLRQSSSNIKNKIHRNRGKIDTLRTHIHEYSLHTFLGLGQAIQ